MVELRKRPAPKETATPPPQAKRGSGAGAKLKALADKAKEAVMPTSSSAAAAPPATAATGTTTTAPATGPATTATGGGGGSGGKGIHSVGDKVADLGSFGSRISTHDGVETSLGELIERSGAGVVVFTYPKASTPGCTTQACLFRDSYAPITGASLAVYGLSTDSPKSNTTFANKHSLPFPLLCDPNATLTSAIGMKKPGPGKSTSRGVVIIDKQGTVKLWEQAGPQKTLDAVLEYIKTEGMTETGAPAAVAAPQPNDPVATEEAAKLADPYADRKMDEVPLVRTPSKEEQEAAETAAEVSDVAAKLDRPE